MRQVTYFVIGEDGGRLGPFTVDELKAMSAEGRIQPATVTEDELGSRSSAGDIPWLREAAGAPPMQPQPAPVPSVPTVPQKGGATWVVPLVLGCGAVIVGFVLIAAVLFPVFAQARMRALQRQSVVNARHLGAAVLLYAEDNDGRLPLDLSTAKAARPAMQTYVTDDQAFTTLNPSGGEFLGNRKISGKKIEAFPSIAQVVLFYESNPWRDRSRVVVWLDGHAKMPVDFDPRRDLGK